MKEKAIERIPYLGLKAVSKKKDAKYIGVTAIETIGGEEHLIVEVYENDKNKKDVPRVRIVMTDKDYGTYIVGEGWTRRKVHETGYYTGWIMWEDKRIRVYRHAEQMIKENIMQSQEDMERIETFLAGVKVWGEKGWWERIQQKQENIDYSRRERERKRKEERREKALRERADNTRKLPKKKIIRYAEKECFRGKHYLYYKRTGVNATVACSACGNITTERWKTGKEEAKIEEPVEGKLGACQECGAKGIYKPQGKVKQQHEERKYIYLGQKCKNGIVVRHIMAEKGWRLEVEENKMVQVGEDIGVIEIARAYFLPGENIQIDYQKRNPFTGENFWDDCNLSGNANIIIRDGAVMPETFEEMKGTYLQYSAAKEYAEKSGEINLIEYLEKYIFTPQIEMLVKMNLIGVANMLSRSRYGIVDNIDAKRPEEFLGIRKEQLKKLMKESGNERYLKVMKAEKSMGQRWTEEQIDKLAELRMERNRIEEATKYMTIQQMLNRIEKYAGSEYGTNCARAEEKLRETATLYTDYLMMRQELGYDLNNTVYQNPRDLIVAHNRMVEERDKKKTEKRMQETRERFANIKKNYQKLRRRYYYSDEECLIRPARSAEEIVIEGRILHHCVGGDSYLQKHNDGKTYILMMRKKAEPEKPYITVEIDANTPRIMQWYGAHDRKTDVKKNQKWLDAYITRLKCETEQIPVTLMA